MHCGEEGPVTCQCCPQHGVSGLDPTIPGMPNIYQSLTDQLPVKLGELGLRSHASLIPYAYYGEIKMSLPHFPTGVC